MGIKFNNTHIEMLRFNIMGHLDLGYDKVKSLCTGTKLRSCDGEYFVVQRGMKFFWDRKGGLHELIGFTPQGTLHFIDHSGKLSEMMKTCPGYWGVSAF